VQFSNTTGLLPLLVDTWRNLICQKNWPLRPFHLAVLKENESWRSHFENFLQFSNTTGLLPLLVDTWRNLIWQKNWPLRPFHLAVLKENKKKSNPAEKWGWQWLAGATCQFLPLQSFEMAVMSH
jgi:hypothetical protein